MIKICLILHACRNVLKSSGYRYSCLLFYFFWLIIICLIGMVFFVYFVYRNSFQLEKQRNVYARCYENIYRFISKRCSYWTFWFFKIKNEECNNYNLVFLWNNFRSVVFIGTCFPQWSQLISNYLLLFG